MVEIINVSCTKSGQRCGHIHRHASKNHALFALRCTRHTPPHRVSRTSREANTRIYLVLCVLLEVFLSGNSSQRHCTAPICIPEVGLRDFQSRHLSYLPSTEDEQQVEDAPTSLLLECSISGRRYSFRSRKERSREGSLCRPTQTLGNGG